MSGRVPGTIAADEIRRSYPMIHADGLSRSIAAFDHDSTLVVVIATSRSINQFISRSTFC